MSVCWDMRVYIVCFNMFVFVCVCVCVIEFSVEDIRVCIVVGYVKQCMVYECVCLWMCMCGWVGVYVSEYV